MSDSLQIKSKWRNRITGYGEMTPDEFLANPENWRVHPRFQQDAMTGILDEVGWVQNVIVNTNTGHLVDGHLRVMLADRAGDAKVPVTFVDLTLEEEALVLATIDPLAALAVADGEKLQELLGGLDITDSDLLKLSEKVAAEADLLPSNLDPPELPPIDDPGAPTTTASFKVTVTNPDTLAEVKNAVRELLESEPEWCAALDD